MDREIEKCRMWTASRGGVATRRRIVNWLLKAERPYTRVIWSNPQPSNEPQGWLFFMRREYPEWVRFQDGRTPQWANLMPDERKQILEMIADKQPTT